LLVVEQSALLQSIWVCIDWHTTSVSY